jgi:hypothetical protein
MGLYGVSLPRASDDSDDISDELSAILAVGKALASLNDPEARLRVLRWANERFNASASLEDAAAPAPVPAVAVDSALSVDELHAFFEQAPRRRDAIQALRYEANDAPHELPHEDGEPSEEPVLRCRAELRVVGRNEALEKAAAHELGDLFDAPAAHSHSDDESIGDPFNGEVAESHDDVNDRIAFAAEPLEDAPVEAPVAARDDRSLDALVSDFASACRLLSLQIQDATA